MIMNYCCHHFEWFISDVGQKGFSILLEKSTDKFYFLLQGRSHDSDDKTGHHYLFQRAIHFCPGCGKNLSDLINENKFEVEDLYELNKKFLNF